MFTFVNSRLIETSLARLMGVQFFEVMNEFNLQDKAHWFVKPEDQPADRQWFGENYQIFEIPPHFQACVSENELPINDGYNIVGNCMFFHGQSPQTGAYESTNWYHLQLIVNGGNGMVKHNSPMDYNYHPDFIMKASSTSGIYEPLRYYHSMNAMYQFRSWSGGPNPNDGRGFRIRVQGPWHIIGRTDSHQLNGFTPSIWPTFLDQVKPGMSKWVLNAQLRQFLTEVQKPGNNLDNWNRLTNGGSNELDSASKTTSQLKNMTSFVGLYYWADKMYYLFPEFKKLGVDCRILEEMIDWSEEAWPNIDWSPFRNNGELQLDLISEESEDCANISNMIIAQTANEGNNPLYEWWVNGDKIENNNYQFDTSELRPGTLLKCRVTSSKQCISNGWVEKEYVLPNTGFEVKVRKNNGAWATLENTVACIDATMEFKIDLNLEEPLFWLDAMDINNNGSEPTEGSSVSKWFNKSSSGHAMRTQTNSALRPTYSKTGMNGLPALMFGMNNADGLELFSTSTDEVLNADWSMVIASKYYRDGGSGDWNAMFGNERSNDGLGFHFQRSDGRSRIKYRGANIYGRSYEDGGSFIVMVIKQGKKVYLYINGKLEQEIESSSANMESSRAFYLGQIDNGNPNAGWFHKGPISEVMFYNHSISNVQKEYLEGYLMHKWRFANKLALDHTFKENSPLYVNLSTPNGETLFFDENVSSNTVLLNGNEKFGDYAFSTSGTSCAASNTVYTITNSGLIGDEIVKYSVNSGKFKVGNQVAVSQNDNLELVPNYEFIGDYQWEQPDGSLLALNTNPVPFVVNQSDNQSVWKFHLFQDVASCILSNQLHQVTLHVSDLPENEKDDDLDGVTNDLDQCPNSIPGAIVNNVGCFDLPVNNYNVQVVGETCLDANDGSISINAANEFNYTATVNGANPQDFTKDLIIENLKSGDYEVCVTVEGEPEYQQCFSLTVEAGEPVTAKSVKTKKDNVITENIQITSGTAPYTISINGQEMLTTHSRSVAIDVNHGDVISIASQFDCEGLFVQDIDLKDHFSASPNPTKGLLNIIIPNIGLKEVTAVVYNIYQQKIFRKTYRLSNDKIEVSLENLPSGIYFVRLELESPVNLKIIKE